MPRVHSDIARKILSFIQQESFPALHGIYKKFETEKTGKDIYNILYRFRKEGAVELIDRKVRLTSQGKQLIHKFFPKKDGVWKLVIFDIPESQRYVRNVLRTKLQALGFQKWQNSIWVSPYSLDSGIETELKQIGKKYFVRLIKTTDINETTDLKRLFPD